MAAGERIVVVGAGRLARALVRTVGERIIGILSRNGSPADDELAGEGRVLAGDFDLLPQDIDTLWILTSDRAIEEVAEAIAARRESWEGVLVVHSSGASPLALLDPFARKGGMIAALHPNWGATGREPIPEGLFWGVSTAPNADRGAAAILEILKGRTVPVEESKRGVYHAAASTASNFSVTLYVMALALYDAAGVDLDDGEEIVRRFIVDSVSRIVPGNPIGALTGPIVRSDRDVVRSQIQGVRENAPELFETFQALVRLTTALVESGRNEGNVGEISTFV